jgi:hypothetical protein
VRWTDRVFAFTRTYESFFPDPPPQVDEVIWLLLESVTGHAAGNPIIFPLNAVKWLTPPRDIAALVTASASDCFTADLYHFGHEPRAMGAELYLLKPGAYRMELLADGVPVRPPTELTVADPRRRLTFDLPPRRLCTLRLSKP